LLRRGLDRGYILIGEELSTVRGHIELGASLRLQARSARRLHCSYDELSYDLLHNRILKASLFRLARAPSLTPDLARELASLAKRMPDITDIWLERSAFSRVQLHRNNAYYDLLLKVCELAFDCLIPAQRGGGYAFQDVLRDEKKMALVFESFVRNFYRAEQAAFAVRAMQLEWEAIPIATSDGVRLPSMKTDIYLESKERRIIIDTKYYADALQQHLGSASFRSGHLYQLFAYLRNEAVAGKHATPAEGMLLYPQVGSSLDARYSIHSHPVRLATIDLAQSWQAIDQRLKELVL
jgi:5-methylcytosine-specific restriction enzyme subunit McrC